jgi:threonine aldolase
VAVPERLIDALESEGFHFYRWPWLKVADGAAIRLVTSYATTRADVDDFLRCAERLS